MNKDATPALINENVKKYGAVVINSNSTVEDEASGVTYGSETPDTAHSSKTWSAARRNEHFLFIVQQVIIRK